MGAVVSSDSLEELKSNELLKRLVGTEPISDNEPVWNQLFSFNCHIDQRKRSEQKEFTAVVDELLESLLYNTANSGNFSTLMRVFIRHSRELDVSVKCGKYGWDRDVYVAPLLESLGVISKIFVWHVTNALFIIRHASLFFARRLSKNEFAKIFRAQGHAEGCVEGPASLEAELLEAEDGEESKDTAQEFIFALVELVRRLEINDSTVALHREAIRVILALISSHLYEENLSVEPSLFIGHLMGMRTTASELVRVLLENFLYQTAEPAPGEFINAKGGSLVLSLATSMWSVIQRTVSLADEDDDAEGDGDAKLDEFPPQTLATLGVALLMTLICYPTAGGKLNPYRDAVPLFQNSQEVSSLACDEASSSSKLDFTVLYNRLCSTVEQPLPLLLLYTLMHKNVGFRNFLLSRVNMEQLVVPVLKVLNERISTLSSAGDASRVRNSHHTYLALIVMLMLSEDDFFCKIVHETKVKNISWYQRERPPLSEISLGGLIILVFVKIIHTNTLRTRDGYLHTNSLAALANMSSCFKSLSPTVCQKLIGLLETMTKRHTKLIQAMRESAEDTEQQNGEEASEGLHRDITALEEGIRALLEILNSCLCNNLRFNADLIYSILYSRELFELYHNHPMFHDLVWNIYVVINHFSSKVQLRGAPSSSKGTTGSANDGTPTSADSSSSHATAASTQSVADVLDRIRRAAVEWPTDRLKRFPELKFKYVEDENTADFFLPYVWRLIYQTCGLYFCSDSIRLFHV